MVSQRGNFLLQALLALRLVVAFMPFFTKKLITRESDAQMFAATAQVETLSVAARIYLRENLEKFPYNITTVAGDDLADMLEPYGLPLGFSLITGFNQNISLVIDRTPEMIFAYMTLTGGNLSDVQRAQLVKRIGFYASADDDAIYVVVPLSETFSNIVRRNETNLDESGFLSDLDMGEFGIKNSSSLLMRNGEMETFQTNELTLFGAEDGRKIRNLFTNLIADKSVFQSGHQDAALSLTRGVLSVGNLSAKTISEFGDTGNFVSNDASVYDFSITAGRSGFSGPKEWSVGGNITTDNISFTTERLEIQSYINASRGQDVFISDDLEYSAASGIEVGILRAANITLRDQTSNALTDGDVGAVILDIRPSDTSFLPDALVDNINSDELLIIENPSDSDDDTIDCKSIINRLDAKYDEKSLSQNIICQYVFWQRLEKRIDIKQCLIDGGTDCE